MINASYFTVWEWRLRRRSRTFTFTFMCHFKSLLILVCVLGLSACGSKSASATEADADFDLAEQLTELADRMRAYLPQVPLDSTQIPRTVENGVLKGTTSKSWTSGFFPGLLWQLYRSSGHEELRQAAEQWQAFVEKEKRDSSTHDLGFK
ncbi:MAG: hypothetical protein D6772_02340, partial [Bacteroidetes bacterium]